MHDQEGSVSSRAVAVPRRRWVRVAVAAAWLAAFAGGVTANTPQASLPDQESLDEIVVEATSLTSLRAEMIRLEDEFYRRFNELNSNDRFDVKCSRDAPTGSRLERRYCRAMFEVRARQEEGVAHWAGLERSTRDVFPLDWIPPLPALMTIEPMKEDLRKELLRVTSEHPELAELLRRRAETAARYEEVYRSRFGR